jgi:3-methyl-2-oxobutanoate hydroxymethyltransferase
MNRVTIETIIEKKRHGVPITLLTAYSFPLASIIDNSGIDIILVGDSVANTELGLESTRSVTMREMLHHAKAVRRGVRNALLVGDMPYEGYQLDLSDALNNAKRFMEEAGCDAVKLEWFQKCPEVTESILKAGIPVMGHIGLTPQTADKIGGFKVQGQDAERATKIIKQALLLESLGIFSLILECVPDVLAGIITKKLKIPTIGIGAGCDCDGQALVTHDMLGLIKGRKKPKFVKEYADIYSEIRKAVRAYKEEVEHNLFPLKEHSYSMKEEEAQKIADNFGARF